MTTLGQVAEITRIATELEEEFFDFDRDSVEIDCDTAEKIGRLATFVRNLSFDAAYLENALNIDKEIYLYKDMSLSESVKMLKGMFGNKEERVDVIDD